MSFKLYNYMYILINIVLLNELNANFHYLNKKLISEKSRTIDTTPITLNLITLTLITLKLSIPEEFEIELTKFYINFFIEYSTTLNLSFKL